MRDDCPLRGASPWQATKLFWTRYAVFTGRASRSEFWWWTLFGYLISLLLEVIRLAGVGWDIRAWWVDDTFFTVSSLPTTLWGFAAVVPTLAQTARRLHDTNRTGWWQMLMFLPIVGGVAVLILCALRPDPRGSRYDSNPPVCQSRSPLLHAKDQAPQPD